MPQHTEQCDGLFPEYAPWRSLRRGHEKTLCDHGVAESVSCGTSIMLLLALPTRRVRSVAEV